LKTRKELYQYIQFDITQYLQEVGEITCGSLKFENIKIVEMLLPGVFLKMTGCIEQKLTMIRKQILPDDKKKKQEKDDSKIPSGSKEVTKILKTLKKRYKEFGGNYNDIWNQNDVLDKAAENIEKTLITTGLSNYLGEKFIFFSQYVILHKKNIAVKSIYDKAINYRNKFAHNEDSIYRDTPTPSELADDKNVYNNFPFRFLAMLYIDMIIRDMFEKYTNIKAERISDARRS
jgi:hypothetical protein